jgi:hypothetical protein
MPAVQLTISGTEDLARKLDRLGGTVARRAMRSAVNASLMPVTKTLRAAINSSPASPELKRQARKTIGKTIGKIKGGPGRGQMQAKAGYAVGKKTTKAERAGKKGVGIGVANIHWFVLGTDKRYLKYGSIKGPKANHPTGKIKPPLAGTMQQAVAALSGAALEAARAKLSAILLKEA